MPTSFTIEVPIGLGRTGERSENVPRVFSLFFGTLQHDVAARLVEPVEHFEIAVEIDALDGGHERLEDLEPAHRTVCRPCRGVSSREVQGVRMRPMKTRPASSVDGNVDGDLALAEFVFANHMSTSPGRRRWI